MESSLPFTDGDLCSSVSQHRDEPIGLRYLVEFQEHIERRLDKKVGHQREWWKKTGKSSR